MRPQRLFVYGTLRRGAHHPMHRVLRRYAVYEGKALACGVLYRLKGYPGAVRSAYCRTIGGELYRIRRPHKLWPLLDRYEACGPEFTPPYEYRREILTVQRKRRFFKAYTYIYRYDVRNGRYIVSGEWLRRGVRQAKGVRSAPLAWYNRS